MQDGLYRKSEDMTAVVHGKRPKTRFGSLDEVRDQDMTPGTAGKMTGQDLAKDKHIKPQWERRGYDVGQMSWCGV